MQAALKLTWHAYIRWLHTLKFSLPAEGCVSKVHLQSNGGECDEQEHGCLRCAPHRCHSAWLRCQRTCQQARHQCAPRNSLNIDSLIVDSLFLIEHTAVCVILSVFRLLRVTGRARPSTMCPSHLLVNLTSLVLCHRGMWVNLDVSRGTLAGCTAGVPARLQ